MALPRPGPPREDEGGDKPAMWALKESQSPMRQPGRLQGCPGPVHAPKGRCHSPMGLKTLTPTALPGAMSGDIRGCHTEDPAWSEWSRAQDAPRSPLLAGILL